MPDNSYGDTVSALDKLAQKVGGPNRGSDKQEAQILRLKAAARKTLNELNQVHGQMKDALNAPEDDPDFHHALAERASMLRNKLYYLNDVGKEIAKGKFEEFKAPPAKDYEKVSKPSRSDDDGYPPSRSLLKREMDKDLYGKDTGY